MYVKVGYIDVGPVQRCAAFQSHPPIPETATGVPEGTTIPRDVVTQKLLKVQLIKITHFSFIGRRLALENEPLSSQTELHCSIPLFPHFLLTLFLLLISNWLIFPGIEINAVRKDVNQEESNVCKILVWSVQNYFAF